MNILFIIIKYYIYYQNNKIYIYIYIIKKKILLNFARKVTPATRTFFIK